MKQQQKSKLIHVLSIDYLTFQIINFVNDEDSLKFEISRHG